MKTILITLCLSVISISKVFAQSSTECLKNIKTGTFSHTDENGKTIIIREEKLQTEHMAANGGGTIVSKVKWLSEDEYELTIKKVIDLDPPILKKGMKIRAKITQCNESSYTCTVNFMGILMEGVKYKIE